MRGKSFVSSFFYEIRGALTFGGLETKELNYYMEPLPRYSLSFEKGRRDSRQKVSPYLVVNEVDTGEVRSPYRPSST